MFDGNKLTKMTALSEAVVYRAMNGLSKTDDPVFPDEQLKQLLAL